MELLLFISLAGLPKLNQTILFAANKHTIFRKITENNLLYNFTTNMSSD